jgi:hypothetical protein
MDDLHFRERMSRVKRGNDSLAPKRQDAIVPSGTAVGHYRYIDSLVRQGAQKLVMTAIDRMNLDVGKRAVMLQERGERIAGRKGRIDADRQSPILAPASRMQLA